MAFAKRIQLTGDPDTYSISPNIKSYALRDLGFTVSQRGTYQYQAPLDQQSPFTPAASLKIKVDANLDGFKMNTVNKSGTATVNIFTHQRAAEFTEQYHFILDEMVNRDIFIKTKPEN